MIYIEINYQNGDSISTKFNGTFQEAQFYYVGKVFNIGTVSDNLQKCVSIRLLSASEPNMYKRSRNGKASVRFQCGLLNATVQLMDNGDGHVIISGFSTEVGKGAFADCEVEAITATGSDVLLWLPRKQ